MRDLMWGELAKCIAQGAWRPILLTLCAWLFVPSAFAQDPLAGCQDQLRGIRVYAERLAKSKQADDLDAAQVIATLIKQLESLQAEMQRMKTAEKPASSGQPAAGSVPEKKE